MLSAINNPSEEVGVKTKTLNLWCDVAEIWLPESYLIKSTSTFKWEDFKDCPCYVGVDLAATSDLTAVSYMIVKDGIYYFKTDYYVPESALLENERILNKAQQYNVNYVLIDKEYELDNVLMRGFRKIAKEETKSEHKSN